jgi:hypothetical protein
MKAGHHHHGVKSEPFNALLGSCDNVQVFSCDYGKVCNVAVNRRGLASCAEPLSMSQMPKLKFVGALFGSFDNYLNGTYTGMKWQCVELARRYWLVNYGMIFDSIPMAYQIFDLQKVRRVSDGHFFAMKGHRNGAKTRPVKGSLLLWNPVGEFRHTGHVAVVLDVQDTYLDIAEQNVQDTIWPPGVNYSRRLRAEVHPETQAYTVHCTYADAVVLGWKTIQFEKASVAE